MNPARLYAEAVRRHQAGAPGAAALYRRVLALDPRHADSRHRLGVLALQAGRPAEAAAEIRQAIACRPGVAAYHCNLGIALKQQGLLEDAAGALRQAVALAPGLAEARNNLGAVLAELGQMDAAIACYRHALAQRPEYVDALNNLGDALLAQDGLAEAESCHRAAIAARPDLADAHQKRGAIQLRQRRLAEAAACFRDAIARQPDHALAHACLGLALLTQGDLRAGWPEYEWRWRTAEAADGRRDFAQQQWRGAPAAGRTILLHAEQGFGDTLQFCRYAPILAARGLRVVLEVQAPLVRLARSLAGVAQVIAAGDALPPFDLHCPLLSLPLALDTGLADIPAETPYLHAPAAILPGRRRIGLAWAGNPAAGAMDRRRSIPPALLAPLLAVPGMDFVSLQPDRPAPPGVASPLPATGDFADTAAVVAGLALVIAVDTAVAHLAGALGRPVWLLDRFDHCWRWLAGRGDSPWYPTMRIFRQDRPGDWEGVIAQAARELAAWR